MSANHDITAIKQWLYRTNQALSEAASDVKYTRQTNKPVYLAFDPSIIFPPLDLRNRLDIANSKDWLDISSSVFVNNLKNYKPNTLGYKMVMSMTTYLTIKKNYRMDTDVIESIDRATTEDEMFEAISARVGHNSQISTIDAALYLSNFLSITQKKHIKLQQLHELMQRKIIICESDVLGTDLLLKSRITYNEYKELLDKVRNIYTSSGDPAFSTDHFIRAIEIISILSTKKKTDLAHNERYLHLAFPRARGGYKSPYKYHRTITSPFYKLIALRQIPSSDVLSDAGNAHLIDIKDQIQFLYRKVAEAENKSSGLTPLIVRGIESRRDEYISQLSEGLEIMENEERHRLARSFTGTKSEVRSLLSEAKKQAHQTRRTLEEMAAEFRLDEEAAGWEEWPDDVVSLITNAKPQPS